MKYKKYFKIKYGNNNIFQYDIVHFGSLGLKAMCNCNLTPEQLNASLRAMKRIIRKKNSLVIKALPFWNLTRKPRDVRMGRGKGTPAVKVFPLKAGKVIFEVKSVEEAIAKRAFKAAARRLPFKVKIIKKYDKRTDCFKGC
jgi:large subunit ribosomal protein L16